MPSITINEIDNTIVSSTMSNDPVTFILGTTTFGPSEHKLLTSMADLGIYGGNIEDTYSFDYAQRILQLGYPVLFYNIANSIESGAQASTQLYGKKTIPEGMTSLDISGNEFNYAYRSVEGLTVAYDSNEDKIKVSGTAEITPIEGTTLGGIRGNILVNSSEVAELIATNDGNEYTISFGRTDVLDPDNNLIPRPEFDVVLEYEEITTPAEGEPTSEWKQLESFKVSFAKETLTDGMTVTAKYKGSYGNNIGVSVYSIPLIGGIKKYALSIYDGSRVVETFELGDSLDSIKDIIENVDSKYVSIVWDTSIVDTDLDKSAKPHKLENGEDATKDDCKKAIEDECDAYIKKSDDSILLTLEDKYSYSIDFVSFAGITDDFDDSKNVIRSAIKTFCGTGRKDCFGILDIPDNKDVKELLDSNYLGVKGYMDSDDSYVAYYYPYCYGYNAKSETKWLPGSYWFLTKILENARNGGNLYDPPAGVKRMSLGNVIRPRYEIGGVLMDKLLDANSKYAVNPIMNIRNYGYTVFGLRTCYTLTPPSSTQVKSALQQPQIRIIADMIKHRIFDVALGLTFDNNNLLTWNSFTNGVESLLSSMKTNNALNDYEIVMNEELQTEDRKTIYGVIRVSVFEAVEDFVIDFQLDPSTVTYNETTVSL